MAMSEQVVYRVSEEVWQGGQPGPERRRKTRRAVRLSPAAWRQSLRVLSMVTLFGLGTVFASVQLASLGNAINGAQSAVQQLTGENAELEAQAAALADPSAIESKATGQLSMQRPAGYVPVAVLTVTPNRVSGSGSSGSLVIPGPSGPAPGGAVATWRSVVHRADAAYHGLLSVLHH